MTPKAEAFLVALDALCREHEVSLSVGWDEEQPYLRVEDLVPGFLPFYPDEIVDTTTLGDPYGRPTLPCA